MRRCCLQPRGVSAMWGLQIHNTKAVGSPSSLKGTVPQEREVPLPWTWLLFSFGECSCLYLRHAYGPTLSPCWHCLRLFLWLSLEYFLSLP